MWGLRLLVATFIAVQVAVVALAHDSNAPPTAYHRWLPQDDWVMEHWIPFDESRLYDELGIGTPRLFSWLANDHRTIADLARRRGVDPERLVRRLSEPWHNVVSDGQYRILRQRTRDLVTQGHLAQHTLFHVFHGTELLGDGHTDDWWGVSSERWNELRLDGLTPNQIARRNGREPAKIRELVLDWLAKLARDGVRRHATSRDQADRMLARQSRVTNCWMKSPLARYDKGNPFGDRYGGHGDHARDDRVGLIRKKPPRGCWKKLTAG